MVFSQDMMIFVFAAGTLGGLFFSLIFGKYMKFWGRKKLIRIGIILLIFSFILLVETLPKKSAMWKFQQE